MKKALRFCYDKTYAYGCIKKEPQPTWRTFNILLERVDLDNPVGHLFMVDISFDYEKSHI